MLLTGTFTRTLDDKQRLNIPKPVREVLQRGAGEGAKPSAVPLYLAPGTDGSLALYPEAAFTRFAERLNRSSPTQQDVRAFSRLFYAQAQRVEMDRQGRVRVPTELAELGGLKKDVVLLGAGDRLEVWDRARWDAYLEQKQPRYDEIAERAFGTLDGLPPDPQGTTDDRDRPSQSASETSAPKPR